MADVATLLGIERRQDLPDFGPGDTVRVSVRVVEGSRERVQVFEGVVIALHAFRNALIPVVTVIGLQVGVLFTGAILTETIFSWPGVGKWLIEAINRRDYPVLQGGLLLLGVVVMVVNLLVDLTYGVINPRIRHAR